MLEIPTLRTERLVLRAAVASDLDAYADYRASERTRYVGGAQSRSQAFEGLCAIIGHWQMRGYGRWIIADPATNEPLGVAGLYFPEDWPEPEIAWTVFQAAEGKGIAFEAAGAARAYAYDTLGWETAISMIAEGNDRSRALAQRLGASLERKFDHPTFGAMEIWRHPAASPVSDSR